ncbi:hypothetical protein [Rhizobium sp. CCGE 510]|uniref:hypothetical protein n=1 Tax=Rhizobium sp. CCGE 510 TaxID=1132836 RepID=UPI0002F6983F|nr:hypothetical protein [Rhizobium sp. CCGE 510]
MAMPSIVTNPKFYFEANGPFLDAIIAILQRFCLISVKTETVDAGMIGATICV